jgi:excisionase family DNA binding protein
MLQFSLSPAQYAARLGVSRQAVMRAIGDGRLPTAAVRIGNRWRIDPAWADEEWQAHTRPWVSATGGLHAKSTS